MPDSNEPLKPEEITPDILTNEIVKIPDVNLEPKISSTSKSNTQNVRRIYIPTSKQKETVLLKPPLMKLVQKNNNENQLPKLKLIIKPNNRTEEAKNNSSTIFVRDRTGASQRILDLKNTKLEQTTNNQTTKPFQLPNRSGAQQRIQVIRKPQDIGPKIDGTANNRTSVFVPQPERLGVPQRILVTRKPQEIGPKIRLDEKTNNQPTVLFGKPNLSEMIQRNQPPTIQEVQQKHSANKKIKMQNNTQPQTIKVVRNNRQVVNNQRNNTGHTNKQPIRITNTQQSSSTNNNPILIQRLNTTEVEPAEIIGIPLDYK